MKISNNNFRLHEFKTFNLKESNLTQTEKCELLETMLLNIPLPHLVINNINEDEKNYFSR